MKRNLTPTQLRRFADGDDRVLFGLEEEVQKNIRLVLRRYRALFVEAATQRNWGADRLQNIADAEAMRAQLNDFLVDAGFSEMIDGYQERHTAVLRRSMDYFSLVGSSRSLAGASLEALDKAVSANVNELFTTINDKWVKPLEGAILRSTFATNSRAEIIDNVRAAAGLLSDKEANNLVSETYQRFLSQARNEQGERLGMEYILYSGPLDNRNSPQCRFMRSYSKHGVAGVWRKKDFTRANVNKEMASAGVKTKNRKPVRLDGDPKIQRGHWNCRHIVLPITEDAVKRFSNEDEA